MELHVFVCFCEFVRNEIPFHRSQFRNLWPIPTLCKSFCLFLFTPSTFPPWPRMSVFPGANSTYLVEDLPDRSEPALQSQFPVKTESSPSPDLLPASNANAQSFRFSLPSQPSSSHGSSESSSRQPSETPPSLAQQPAVYRFGANTSATPGYGLLPPVSSSWVSTDSAGQMDSHSKYDINLENAMSFNDDYDDVGELMDLPSMGGGGLGSIGGSGTSGDKPVRRRSSKGACLFSAVSSRGYTLNDRSTSACDQCRKSKCKCERSSPNEPCRSCVMLGTGECQSILLATRLFDPSCPTIYALAEKASCLPFLASFDNPASATVLVVLTNFCSMHIFGSVAQERTAEGLHRCYRGSLTPDRSLAGHYNIVWGPARTNLTARYRSGIYLSFSFRAIFGTRYNKSAIFSPSLYSCSDICDNILHWRRLILIRLITGSSRPGDHQSSR